MNLSKPAPAIDISIHLISIFFLWLKAAFILGLAFSLTVIQRLEE